MTRRLTLWSLLFLLTLVGITCALGSPLQVRVVIFAVVWALLPCLGAMFLRGIRGLILACGIGIPVMTFVIMLYAWFWRSDLATDIGAAAMLPVSMTWGRLADGSNWLQFAGFSGVYYAAVGLLFIRTTQEIGAAPERASTHEPADD